jgi:hypothetical protein
VVSEYIENIKRIMDAITLKYFSDSPTFTRNVFSINQIATPIIVIILM